MDFAIGYACPGHLHMKPVLGRPVEVVNLEIELRRERERANLWEWAAALGWAFSLLLLFLVLIFAASSKKMTVPELLWSWIGQRQSNTRTPHEDGPSPRRITEQAR